MILKFNAFLLGMEFRFVFSDVACLKQSQVDAGSFTCVPTLKSILSLLIVLWHVRM